MKTTAKIDVKTKSGIVYPAGSEFDVVMAPGHNSWAIATPIVGDGKGIKMIVTKLHKYMDGFIAISSKDVEDYIEEDESVSTARSLTGATVEPDGEDEFGFPSVYRALGYI